MHNLEAMGSMFSKLADKKNAVGVPILCAVMNNEDAVVYCSDVECGDCPFVNSRHIHKFVEELKTMSKQYSMMDLLGAFDEQTDKGTERNNSS
jgi:hypothetical protein